MIHYFYHGEEYTTRTRLYAKYPISHTTLQELLQRLGLPMVSDANRHYYLKSEVEAAVERHLNRTRTAPVKQRHGTAK